MAKPASSISESSGDTSSISNSPSPCACFQKTWRRYRPGSYFAVFVVNVTATALLLTRDYDIRIYIPLFYRVLFFVQTLANFGVGCAAAFLHKKARASAHLRLASNCAIVNWLACLTHTLYPFVHFMMNLLSRFLMLVTMFLMQMLIAGRLEILERVSKQSYRSARFQKLIWEQVLGATACALSLGAAVLFRGLPMAIFQSVDVATGMALLLVVRCLCLLGALAVVQACLCNVVASAAAISSLTQCSLQLRTLSRTVA